MSKGPSLHIGRNFVHPGKGVRISRLGGQSPEIDGHRLRRHRLPEPCPQNCPPHPGGNFWALAAICLLSGMFSRRVTDKLYEASATMELEVTA